MEEMSEGISTDIFTFSGTGNSLVLAEAIAAELGGGNVRLITKDLLDAKQLISRADRVGFVYPVYFMNMPWPVKTVMERLVLTGPCRLFAVATCARMEGLAVEEAEILWQQRGRRLEWGFVEHMPGNSVIVSTESPERERRLARTAGRAADMARMIKGGEPVREDSPRAWQRAGRHVTRWAYERIWKTGDKGSDGAECTGCGLCSRVCPMGNIALEGTEGKELPVWGDNCADCFACLHWCPSHAVRAGKLRVGEETAYTHPGVRDARQGVKVL